MHVLEVLDRVMLKSVVELSRSKGGGMVVSGPRMMRAVGNQRIGLSGGCCRREGRRGRRRQWSSCRAERSRDGLAIGVVSATVERNVVA